MSEGLVDEEDGGAAWPAIDPSSSEALGEEVCTKGH